MRSVALITLTWRKPTSRMSFREFLKLCQDGKKRKKKNFRIICYTHFKRNTIVCSIHCVLCITKYCGKECGLTYVFNQHIVPLVRLFQWRGDEIRDGSSSAGSGRDEEHQLASARVKLTCKQCGLIQGQPGQVDLTPAMCTHRRP